MAEFIKLTLKISFDKIVLYLYSLNIFVFRFGHSLGSVPTIHLASRKLITNILKGIILISPIGSGIKIVNPSIVLDFEKLSKINCFNNDNKLQDINCQIFLIHGQKDEVIPYKRSEELLKLNNRIVEWFPKK